MRTKSRTAGTYFTPALETIILIGLSLKLVLSIFFLSLTPHVLDLPIQAKTAHAQETPADNVQTAPPAETSPQPTAGETAESAPPQPNADATMTEQALQARTLALQQKEIRLKEREDALNTLEKELNRRLDEIEATRKKLAELVEKQEQLLEEQKALKNARIEHLVTAYKGMRPENAGKLVDSLEDDVAVAILSAMPGRSAGQILANVKPEKAARLTKAISMKKTNPAISPVDEEPPPED
jgi:flagellar motility protein MotE (MotC chaperone)